MNSRIELTTYPLNFISSLPDVFRSGKFEYKGVDYDFSNVFPPHFKGSFNVIPTNLGLLVASFSKNSHTFGNGYDVEYREGERKMIFRSGKYYLPDGDYKECSSEKEFIAFRKQSRDMIKGDIASISFRVEGSSFIIPYSNPLSKFILHKAESDFNQFLSDISVTTQSTMNNLSFEMPKYLDPNFRKFKRVELRSMRLFSLSSLVGFIHSVKLFQRESVPDDIMMYAHILNLSGLTFEHLLYMPSPLSNQLVTFMLSKVRSENSANLSNLTKPISLIGSDIHQIQFSNGKFSSSTSTLPDVLFIESLFTFNNFAIRAQRFNSLPMIINVGTNPNIMNQIASALNSSEFESFLAKGRINDNLHGEETDQKSSSLTSTILETPFKDDDLIINVLPIGFKLVDGNVVDTDKDSIIGVLDRTSDSTRYVIFGKKSILKFNNSDDHSLLDNIHPSGSTIMDDNFDFNQFADTSH